MQSEEIKFVAVHTVFYLLQSSTDEVVEELFAAANKPLLGHLVFTLLKVSTYEEMKELRYSFSFRFQFLFFVINSFILKGYLLWIVLKN